MDDRPLPIMDSPGLYRIEISGCPSVDFLEAMWGRSIALEEGAETAHQCALLVGVTDQAALVGFINALYNLGHAILSIEIVQRTPPGFANWDVPE